MYLDCTDKSIAETLKSLKTHRISIYKIAEILGESRPTLYNIFKNKKTKYSEDRVIDIMDRINIHLEGMDISKAKDKARKWFNVSSDLNDSPEIVENTNTYSKLYELGLNSKLFTPAEKLHLALMYKKIEDFKNQLNKENTTPNGEENRSNSKDPAVSGETVGSQTGVHS